MSDPRKQKPPKTKITRTECPKEAGMSGQKSAIINCRTLEWNHSFPFESEHVCLSAQKAEAAERLSINPLMVICPGKASVAALGQRAGPKGLAMSLFCWNKPVSRRQPDSPCSLREENRSSSCSGRLVRRWGACAVSLYKAGERRREGKGSGGRYRGREGEK